MDRLILTEALRAALVKSVELLHADLPTSQQVEVFTTTMVLIGYGLELDAENLENLPEVEAKN